MHHGQKHRSNNVFEVFVCIEQGFRLGHFYHVEEKHLDDCLFVRFFRSTPNTSSKQMRSSPIRLQSKGFS